FSARTRTPITPRSPTRTGTRRSPTRTGTRRSPTRTGTTRDPDPTRTISGPTRTRTTGTPTSRKTDDHADRTLRRGAAPGPRDRTRDQRDDLRLLRGADREEAEPARRRHRDRQLGHREGADHRSRGAGTGAADLGGRA